MKQSPQRVRYLTLEQFACITATQALGVGNRSPSSGDISPLIWRDPIELIPYGHRSRGMKRRANVCYYFAIQFGSTRYHSNTTELPKTEKPYRNTFWDGTKRIKDFCGAQPTQKPGWIDAVGGHQARQIWNFQFGTGRLELARQGAAVWSEGKREVRLKLMTGDERWRGISLCF